MGEKFTSFILKQSFKIMIAGFLITGAGIIMLFGTQHRNDIVEKIAFGVTAFGLGCWLIGRVCIVLHNRRLRKQREQAAQESSGPET